MSRITNEVVLEKVKIWEEFLQTNKKRKLEYFLKLMSGKKCAFFTVLMEEKRPLKYGKKNAVMGKEPERMVWTKFQPAAPN